MKQQQSANNHLAERNQELTQQLSSKIEELERERNNRLAIENALSSQNNSEIEHLLQLKNKMEK